MTDRVLGVCRNSADIKGDMKDKAHWTELCRQAAVEQDPKKLLLLVTEINRLLAEKQERVARITTEDKK